MRRSLWMNFPLSKVEHVAPELRLRRYLEGFPTPPLMISRFLMRHFFFVDRLIAFDHKEKKTWANCVSGCAEKDVG